MKITRVVSPTYDSWVVHHQVLLKMQSFSGENSGGFLPQRHEVTMLSGHRHWYYGWCCEILHHQQDGRNPHKQRNFDMNKNIYQLVQDFAPEHENATRTSCNNPGFWRQKSSSKHHVPSDKSYLMVLTPIDLSIFGLEIPTRCGTPCGFPNRIAHLQNTVGKPTSKPWVNPGEMKYHEISNSPLPFIS